MATHRIPIDDPAPTPPAPPDDGECCQSGCNPCVFDLYEDAVDRYRIEYRAWEQRRAARKNDAGRVKKKK